MAFSFGICCVLFLAIYGLKANEFDYEHQAKWYDEFKECSMDRQSPIELTTNDAVLSFDIPSISFQHYNTAYSLPAESENNGHTANINLPKPKGYIEDLWHAYDKLSPHITGGPLARERFVAESLHFHWGSRDAHGSEHVIDGQRYSLEMHILHRNSKYKTVEQARGHADGLAVVAVLYNVQKNTTNHFAGLESVLNALQTIAEFNKTSKIEHFVLSTLFGGLDLTEFFTYEGSLTTPPCSRAVTWIVFSHIIPISHEQMNRFHSLSDGHKYPMDNNYRSLQAKGNRKVYFRSKEKIIESIIESPLFWDIIKILKPESNELDKAAKSDNKV